MYSYDSPKKTNMYVNSLKIIVCIYNLILELGYDTMFQVKKPPPFGPKNVPHRGLFPSSEVSDQVDGCRKTDCIYTGNRHSDPAEHY